jgi:Tfp pilus assembly protein PilW
MAEEKKDSKSKVIIVLLIVVIVLLIGGGVAAFLLMNNNGEGQTEPAQTAAADTAVTAENKNNSPLLKYDDAAVALDENGLEKQIEEMKKNSEGNVSLEYKNEAESTDGTHFICYLANSDLNTEDMFIAIFTDANMTEQVYLSGLLRPGTSIQEFDSEIPFEKGKHSVVCMFTSVGDDHNTMTSQIAVEIMLTVK